MLLTLLQYLVLALVLAVLARDALRWYAQMMTMTDPAAVDPSMMALPDGIALAMLVSVVVGLVMYGVQSIGACQVALRGRGVFGAIGDGASGTVRNLLPLVVLAVVVVAAVIATAIVGGILALVVAVARCQNPAGWSPRTTASCIAPITPRVAAAPSRQR